jgi:hypothetical protein
MGSNQQCRSNGWSPHAFMAIIIHPFAAESPIGRSALLVCSTIRRHGERKWHFDRASGRAHHRAGHRVPPVPGHTRFRT